MGKRAKLEIMRDILEIIKNNKNSMKPTPLLRKSGLSSAGFKEYYFDLLRKRLVKESINKEDKVITLTDMGFRFLERYRTIVDFIEEFDL